MDEVIELFPNVGVMIFGETSVPFSALPTLTDLVRPCTPIVVTGSALVIPPYLFAVVSTQFTV